MKRFSQFRQREGNRFKQRLVPFFNGVYGMYAKLRRAVGNPIVISDASDEPLSGLKVFGKSTQNGTPTPDAPVEIVSVENPTVKVDTQNLSVPYTLHGIPVTSGGNYTDENGQQWVCDEVDFSRGVYVQRTRLIDLTDLTNWATWGVNANVYGITGFYHFLKHGIKQNDVICNLIPCATQVWGGRGVGSLAFPNPDAPYIGISIQTDMLSNTNDSSNAIESFEKIISEKNGEMLIVIDPIETPLTTAQIAAYKALHTNEPNTTISNDKNAWMEVMYTSK